MQSHDMAAWFVLAAALIPPTIPPASQPASLPAVVQFDRHIRIDWSVPQVEIDAAVVLSEGYLELFACSGDAKAHESIIRTEARPQRVFLAMGLIGLTPGRPARWNAQRRVAEPADGDPVELRIRYDDRGRMRDVPAHEWLLDLRTNRPLSQARWIFAGSQRLKDGSYGADVDGVLAATVDFPTAVIALAAGPAAAASSARGAASRAASRPAAQSEEASADVHVSTPDELQAGARPDRVPAVGTRVTLLVRAARAQGSAQHGAAADDTQPAGRPAAGHP